MERKFTRGGGIIGHIEDIAVSKSMQGRKLGLKIINSLEAIGRGQGCYKIILDCSKDNIRMSHFFYTGLSLIWQRSTRSAGMSPSVLVWIDRLTNRFKHKEYQMVRYMEDPAPTGIPRSNSAKL